MSVVQADFSNEPWVGVDFDGTLVEHCYPAIGKPIAPMVNFVKMLRANGVLVKIMTARVGPHGYAYGDGTLIDPDFTDRQRAELQAWCHEHLGEIIPITATKDFCMVALYDDRAVQIITDMGLRADGFPLHHTLIDALV